MKLTWIVLVHKYVQYVGNIETKSHEFSVSPVLKLPNVFFFFFFCSRAFPPILYSAL